MQLPAAYIVLDTETTGLKARLGHRIMEIAAIKMSDGHEDIYHRYINPDRDVDPQAFAKHKITPEMIEDAPQFAEIADEVITFLGDLPLYIHNASFDMDFLEAELTRAQRPLIARHRAVCTLEHAVKAIPGLPSHKLESLARALRIDYEKSHLHGALGDTQLLHKVIKRMPDLPASPRPAPPEMTSPLHGQP